VTTRTALVAPAKPKPKAQAKAKAKAAPSAPLVPLPGAVAFFKRLCGLDCLAVLLNPAGSYDRCWTPKITLMAMMLGHLIGEATLETVVAFARTGRLDSLCAKAKKVSDSLKETDSTAGYAQARARLGVTWLRHCLGAQARSIQTLAGGWQWHNMEVRCRNSNCHARKSIFPSRRSASKARRMD
jgi:hypothetical protein